MFTSLYKGEQPPRYVVLAAQQGFCDPTVHVLWPLQTKCKTQYPIAGFINLQNLVRCVAYHIAEIGVSATAIGSHTPTCRYQSKNDSGKIQFVASFIMQNMRIGSTNIWMEPRNSIQQRGRLN